LPYAFNILNHSALSTDFLSENKKAELTKGSSFGSSAMLRWTQHPPLSAPSLQRVWLYRETAFLFM
jgi:hypothetical protein